MAFHDCDMIIQHYVGPPRRKVEKLRRVVLEEFG